jgi:2-polyprenyl-3-methyl-5-hydroxy-6-metoxy-1,4-benzoquinol methylase
MLAFILGQPQRALEVGCGEGNFSSGIQGLTESWGIEPTPAAEVARNNLTHVIQSTYDNAVPHLPNKYFDLVICNDVIEHLQDHDYFFESIKSFMAPGAAIIGSIPNIRFFDNLFRLVFEKDWEYCDEGILDRTHLRFFTERSLKKCLLRHGYAIEMFYGLKPNLVLYHHKHERRYRRLSRALIFAFGKYFSDIQYLQFGFRARLL